MARVKGKNLVVMDRDVETLFQIHVHRTITSGQLARLTFADSTYETARKRLRRLMQSGLIGYASSERSQARGRPELIYFLTRHGANVLAEHRAIVEEIPVGAAHTYHKEHYLKLVDIRLSLEEAQSAGLIKHFSWIDGREFASNWSKKNDATLSEYPDAAITFAYPKGEPMVILLELDTGNFRQTRNWEPKVVNFLITGNPIWVVANNYNRVTTLAEWTLPLLKAAGVGPGKCVFSIFSEIVDKGIFQARWWRADGTHSELRPRR